MVNDAGHTGLIIATSIGCVASVKSLRDGGGCNVDPVGSAGQTALIAAVEIVCVEIVRLLLAGGTYVNAADKAEEKAFTIGVKIGIMEIIGM